MTNDESRITTIDPPHNHWQLSKIHGILPFYSTGTVSIHPTRFGVLLEELFIDTFVSDTTEVSRLLWTLDDGSFMMDWSNCTDEEERSIGETVSPRPLMIRLRLLGVEEDLLLLVDKLLIEFSCDIWLVDDCSRDDDDTGIFDRRISSLLSVLIVDTIESPFFTGRYAREDGNEINEEEEVDDSVGNN